TDVQLRLCVVSSLSAVALAAGDGDEALTDPLLTVPYEYDEVVEGWGRLHIHFDRRRLGEVDSRPALELHELFTAFFQEQFLSVGSCDGIQRSQPHEIAPGKRQSVPQAQCFPVRTRALREGKRFAHGHGQHLVCLLPECRSRVDNQVRALCPGTTPIERLQVLVDRT